MQYTSGSSFSACSEATIPYNEIMLLNGLPHPQGAKELTHSTNVIHVFQYNRPQHVKWAFNEHLLFP